MLPLPQNDEAEPHHEPECEPQGRATGYWIVARCVNEKTNVLIVEVPGGERLLPVFSGAAETEMFVWLSGLGKASGDGWFARRTAPGELLSMLIGPRRSVRRVALDPSPELMGADSIEREIELVCISRKDFVERLLSERGPDTLSNWAKTLEKRDNHRVR